MNIYKTELYGFILPLQYNGELYLIMHFEKPLCTCPSNSNHSESSPIVSWNSFRGELCQMFSKSPKSLNSSCFIKQTHHCPCPLLGAGLKWILYLPFLSAVSRRKAGDAPGLWMSQLQWEGAQQCWVAEGPVCPSHATSQCGHTVRMTLLPSR